MLQMNHKYSGPLGQGIDKINTTASTEHYNKNFKILKLTETTETRKNGRTESHIGEVLFIFRYTICKYLLHLFNANPARTLESVENLIGVIRQLYSAC